LWEINFSKLYFGPVGSYVALNSPPVFPPLHHLVHQDLHRAPFGAPVGAQCFGEPPPATKEPTRHKDMQTKKITSYGGAVCYYLIVIKYYFIIIYLLLLLINTASSTY
jgi:hypothetical protein